MTTDIKILTDKDLVDALLKLRERATHEDCCGSARAEQYNEHWWTIRRRLARALEVQQ